MANAEVACSEVVAGPALVLARESTNESTAPLGLKAQAGTRFRRPAVPAAPTPAGTIGSVAKRSPARRAPADESERQRAPLRTRCNGDILAALVASLRTIRKPWLGLTL
jgi:hypothetical protein